MATRSRSRVDLGTFVVFTCLVSGACATARHDRPPGPPFSRVDVPALPALGAPFRGSDPPAYLQLTSSGSIDPAYPISVRGVRFDVAVSRRDGTVVYESTTDPAFQTLENIHVGSGLADVLAAGAPEPIREPGWGFWTTLPSGWHVAFVSEPYPTDGPLSPNATVRWLFRR
ncbi:MAG TPA: hypothetical protein VF469_30200 [Kofleriaceae bacterium]